MSSPKIAAFALVLGLAAAGAASAADAMCACCKDMKDKSCCEEKTTSDKPAAPATPHQGH